MLHGLVLLIIQGQVPGNLLKTTQPKEMVLAALKQIVRVPINTKMFNS
jgi:hypothetical protein